jgi:hypothetical protein
MSETVSKQVMIIGNADILIKTSSLGDYYVQLAWFTFRNVRRLAYNPQFQELNKNLQAELTKPSC